jgi:flagellar biosynthetic protein FlhB
MSEDRTQAPSKIRRQQAREHGQAAFSAELTAASTLLAATLLLGPCGRPMLEGMLKLFTEDWTDAAHISFSIEMFVERMRDSVFTFFLPFAGLLVGLVVVAVATHQAQVGGLWAPVLLAPNPTRLWGGQRAGFSSRLGRGIWMLAKTGIIVGVATWAISVRFDSISGLGRLEIPVLALAWLTTLQQLTATLAFAMLLLGLLDYVIQSQRFEALLKLTPAESREDQKAAEGDPALRSRRMRIAKSWRGDSPELLAGATLAVVGPRGLIALLAGGPPPKRVHVRSLAKGSTGTQLRKSCERAGITVLENPSLARRLAILRLPSLPPELAVELKSVWPS